MASRPHGIEDLLHCMICFESFTEPKMLACGHTFCQECLVGYLKTYRQQRRAQPGKLPCPTCRDLTTLPARGISALRNDFKAVKLEEMFKTVNIRDRMQSKFCDSCKARKRNSPSDGFCEDCSCSYCSECLQKHNKNPLFSRHALLSRNMSSESGEPPLVCNVHEGEQAKFFCRTCLRVVCTLCVMDQHESCDVLQVSQVHQQYGKDIRTVKQLLDEKRNNLESSRQQLETLRKLLLHSAQETEIAIKSRASKLREEVGKCEEEMLAELRRRRDAKLEAISNESDSNCFRSAKAFSLSEFASHNGHQNSIKMMALHDELIQRMRTITDAEVTEENDLGTVISFVPSRNGLDFGKFTDVEADPRNLNNNKQASNVLPMSKILSSPSRLKPRLLVVINGQGSSPGQLRDPLGIACLLNGDIVVTEWGNKRIQVFDNVGKHVAVVGKGNHSPQGVAVTLKGNLIVSDSNNKRLEEFAPQGELISKWGLGKFYSPCGVSVCPNGCFIVSDVAEHSVTILSSDKRIRKRFGRKGRRDDQFDKPLYVTSGLHNEVIVSDSDNHCLKVFNRHGGFKKKIGGEGDGDGRLKYPRGVCTDWNGNLIVADRNNDRVSLFSMHGAFLGHVLTRKDGIREPYAVTMTVTRNLVVTESSAKHAAVKLFQL